MRNKYILIGIVVGVLLASVAVVLAGQIDSPQAPTHADAQMYTLEQIYQRLNSSTAAAKMTTFTEPSSGPGSTMHTLDEIYALIGLRAQVPKTGQTKCYNAAGAEIACTGTGQDGDLQKGVTWPTPRFTDNSNGTVTDNLTGLMWAENANLPSGKKTWNDAIDYCNSLSLGGHTDWRLPNVRELHSLIDFSQYNPALPSGHPFENVKTDDYYWASTTYAGNTTYPWYVYLLTGYVSSGENKTSPYYVWPVRGGQ
jgi:hypothetical protein